MMYRALGDKKQRELVLIEGGDHSLSRYDARMVLLSKLEGFLAANLGQPVAAQ
jgi:hypothetical protein